MGEDRPRQLKPLPVRRNRDRLAGKRQSRAIAAVSRALARATRASKRRQHLEARLATLRRREANARSTTLHQYSAALTRRFATIVVEDLSIANMMRSAKGTREKPGTRCPEIGPQPVDRRRQLGPVHQLSCLRGRTRRWAAHPRQAAQHEQSLLTLRRAHTKHHRG